MCPHCGRSTPVRFDAGVGRCSACGASRSLVGGASLALAGEPQRIGGLLASGLGWVILLGGLAAAGFLGWLGVFLFATMALVKYVALPLAILSTLVGGGVLAVGQRLKKNAARSRREAQVAALRAAASLQGGALTVAQAAVALRVPEAEADALLTELAIAEQVRQEVTDQGILLYVFQGARGATPGGRLRVPGAPLRVEPSSPEDIRVEELEALVEPPRAGRKAVG
jgi:hypothetical protein